MSTAYTLDHVVADLVDERAKPDSQNRAPRGSEFYYDSWEALNRWLESRLKQRKGGTISPLGNFTWEFRETEDGVRQCRPIFLLGDSYRKDHHIRGNKFHPPVVAPTEEANFSIMAIKFSKSLTKDMLFAGIKDIIKKIGDYIDRIVEVEVEFSFGILRCKERRVTFEFDNSRLRQILPRQMAAELEEKELGYSQESSQFNKDYHQEAQSSSVDLSLTNTMNTADSKSGPYETLQLPPLDLPQTGDEKSDDKFDVTYYDKGEEVVGSGRPTASPATSSEVGESKTPFVMPKLLYNGTYKDVDPNKEQRPVSPGLQKVLEGYEKELFSHQAKIARRMKACDTVTQQAFDRCLNGIETETKLSDYTDYQDRMLRDDWNAYSAYQRTQKQKTLDDIKRTVQQQMQIESDRRKADRLERKMTQVPLGLPGQVVLPVESRETIKKKKEELRCELRQTIDNEAAAKKELKKKLDQEERDRLAVLAKEIDVEEVMDRRDKLTKQRDMLDAWEREAHIRNLKKIQKKKGNINNVQTYIETANLRDKTYTPNSSRSGFMMGSVGFDSRKRK